MKPNKQVSIGCMITIAFIITLAILFGTLFSIFETIQSYKPSESFDGEISVLIEDSKFTPAPTTRVIRNDTGKIILTGRREGSKTIWRNPQGRIVATE